MNKKIFLLLSLIFAFASVQAEQFAYQINFTNKNGTITIADSTSFLSPRSLARRANQHIRVDSTDIPVSRVYIDSVLALTGSIFHGSSKWLNCCVILISDSTDIHTLDGISFIQSKKLVGYYAGILHHKQSNSNSLQSAVNAYKTTSWGASYYANTWEQTAIVNGQILHNVGHLGSGKWIAVFDAGFLGTNTHPGFDTLWADSRIVDTFNFVHDTDFVFSYDSHGTSALSTISGYTPNVFVGTAPKASIALYLTEDNTSEQPIELLNMVMGMERADSVGIDIISSSLGYNTFDNPVYDFNFSTDFDGKTTVAAIGANMASQKGILVVTSAGNEGANSWNKILTPGDADSAFTIGSVRNTGIISANSGYGPNVAGVIKPDVCALGAPAACFSSSGYTSIDGTSFSTPQVAGWAACIWEAVPDKNQYEIKEAIRRCASKYTSPDAQYGFGIPNFLCTIQSLDVKDSEFWNFTPRVSYYPNPVYNELNIKISVPDDDEIELSIIDLAGRISLKKEFTLKMGTTLLPTINTMNLSSGLYIIRVESKYLSNTFKVVKQ